MKFRDLYLKGLDRTVNPAVSASDLNEETINVEINEYVFTNEIINNLYKILNNIRENQGSHTGIWINGYYGSGKSHFLKYVNYCLSKKHGAEALKRLRDAVAEREPMELDVEVGELDNLIRWYTNNATIDSIMFNIGTVHDANSTQKTVFTQVFWNEFNGMRGFNKNHLALAQYLEKALEEDGKYEEFLEYVKNKGYDWKRSIHRFSGAKLDLALQMASEVDPHISIDVIRERIKNNDINISVESFANELKEYIDQKHDKNYRIVFFVDEISQFIDGRTEVLLQLQEVVTRVCEICNSQVWFACTAQQDLSQVIQSCNIAETNENYGKIMGRFEVRASLQGTSPEYITQKRILDKKGEVEIELENIYNQEKAKLDAQFVLPTTYQAFKNCQDFAAYYPFVPYQFQLIMKVLDSFTKMNYVDKQVKGNERSLINITYSIAKETADQDLGEFVPFDRFFGAMFQGSMQHLGQKAIENGKAAVRIIDDPKEQEFYQRVLYVLFMICNLAEEDKQQFSATIDNIVTLLMTKIDASKASIKNEVAKVLDYLVGKAVIRRVKTETGSEIYEFYTEEESKVAQIISNQQVDSNTYSDELRKIIFSYFNNPGNKETYATRSFSVGINIEGRTYLSNNPDIYVDFITNSSVDTAEQYAFTNDRSHLAFFMYPQFIEDNELRSNFIYYCRVQKFMQESAISEEREKTKAIFRERANELYKRDIEPRFQHILDTCPIVSGQNALTAFETGTAKRAERYKAMINYHLSNLYQYASMVNVPEVPKNQYDLSKKITRPIEETLIEVPLSEIEKKVLEYMKKTEHDITVADVTKNFSKVPYGWSEIATIYVINELVRRHLYSFEFNRNSNITKSEIANNIVKEQAKFSIVKARAIDQKILNDFIDSWKHIFNVMDVKGSNDSTELYNECREKPDSALNKLTGNYRKLSHDLGEVPFRHIIDEAIELLEKWYNIRDHKIFFETITAARDEASLLFDRCKNINSFHHDNFSNYKMIRAFITTNNDNFTFINEDCLEAIDTIKEIMDDEEPWSKLPSYMKIKRQLETKLKEFKHQLVEKISDEYGKKFDELENYAKSVNVNLNAFANRNATIASLTNTDNFYALQNALQNVNRFYETEFNRINTAIPHPDPVTPPTTPPVGPTPVDPIKPDTPVVPPVKPARKQKMVHLNTHFTTPIRNEADIDKYLERLKKQLMGEIGGEEDIIIF